MEFVAIARSVTGGWPGSGQGGVDWSVCVKRQGEQSQLNERITDYHAALCFQNGIDWLVKQEFGTTCGSRSQSLTEGWRDAVQSGRPAEAGCG